MKHKRLPLIVGIATVLPVVLTIFYIIRDSMADGSKCTFDNFDCPANNYFFAALCWGFVSFVLLMINLGLYLFSRAKKTKLTNKKGKT